VSTDPAQSQKFQQNQMDNCSTRNLDLAGCGQYGPRGFKGRRGAISFNPRARIGLHIMAEGTNDNSGHGSGDKSTDEAALSARLGSLDQRLSELRDGRATGTDQPGVGSGDAAARASAMARGLRLSSELIAGVLVGAVLGWGFDRLLSTSPFGFIVFFLLGFAAGVVNVVRSAGVAPHRTGR
jgi:ATP synthase protein I